MNSPDTSILIWVDIKYDLVVAIWEGEKLIGTGIKYATVTLENAVEKKKKIVVNMTTDVIKFYPVSFTA